MNTQTFSQTGHWPECRFTLKCVRDMVKTCSQMIQFFIIFYKELDANLAWLTQKSEEPKSNKGNFTFPIHTVNIIEM